MKLTFLGTGTSQGVPMVGCQCQVCSSLDYRDKRLRTSILLQYEGTNLLVDPGPDFRVQVLRAGIPRLDALIITHEHKDHTGGLDDIRGFNYLQQERIPLYAWQRVLTHLESEYAYAFGGNPYPGTPQLDLIPINGHFQIGSLHFDPVTVWHARLPVLGFIINGMAAYLTDCNRIDEEELTRLENLPLVVLDALQQDKHISHYTLQEALEVLDRLKPAQAYLTHIGHRMGRYLEIQAKLPKNIALAYDGLIINSKE